MKRWPKVRCICTTCKKLRIVTPLYETTKQEREEMARNYVCSDCTPEATILLTMPPSTRQTEGGEKL